MKPQTVPSTHPPYYCGIDVGKNKHVACVIDRDGALQVRSQSFANDAQGYQRLWTRLHEVGTPQQIAVAMEATGPYWYSLHDFLVRRGYEVVVLNPIQTAQQAKKGIRKSQTDRIDARHIATLLKNGEGRPALIPGELGMTCRQLTRLHQTQVRQQARIKQLLWTWIHPTWPEYEALFTDPFCKTGRRLLETAPTPQDVLDLPTEQWCELLRRTSRGKYGPAKAETVRQAAETSVGMRRGLPATRIGVRSLLAQLEALDPIRKRLEADIRKVGVDLPDYLRTLPGATDVSTASLFGETDPIDAFTAPAQLVAFTGLDLVVSESGEYKAPRRRISKRGSPYLRRTLWNMAHRACKEEGDLRDYVLRRRRQGLHYFEAVTAAALKLTHIVWRIMTDRRDYLPQRPERKTVSAKP